jgi:hypothetical protein
MQIDTTHQAQIPRLSGQFVHLPAYAHHQHLVRRRAREPGKPEAHKLALMQ